MKYFYIAVAVFLLPVTIFSQTVNIPDVNFKQALLNNSSINTNSDTEIQVSEAEAYTGAIGLYNLGISDLTGIESFVNITSLNVSSNNLSSIDVSFNTELTSLGLNRNNLSSLDVTNNTKLTYLSFEENSISAIDLSNNILLESFYCKDNGLQTIDFSANPALQFLGLDNNQLQTLDVSNLTSLTNLVCRDNLLTSIDVSNNLNLSYFLISQNQISSLDVSNNDKLETFWCGYNGMTSLVMPVSSTTLTHFACNNNALDSVDISNFPNLEVFTCSSNNLTTIDLSGISSLTAITCGYNNITELDVSGQPSLTYVSAGWSSSLASVNVKNGNNTNFTNLYLRNIDPNAIICVDDVAYATTNFANVDNTATFTDQCQTTEQVVYIPDPNFKSRILNHNPVIDTNGDNEIQFSEAENFNNTMDVSNYDFDTQNLIVDLTGLEAFINLTGFSCSSHDVNQSVDFTTIPSITNIDLNGNQITGVVVSPNANLTSLDVGGNSGITNISITSNINLEYLNIRHTGITSIDLSQNTKLVELEAFASDLNLLDLSNNTELVRLSLGGTNITSMNLSYNTKLEHLEWQSNLYNSIDLSSNVNLKHFAGFGTAFSTVNLTNNSNLEYLDLSSNIDLTGLDLSNNSVLKDLLISDTNLSSLDLSNNTVLERLNIANAQFSDLDLSNNELLKTVNVRNNLFSSLDFSCLENLISVDVSNSSALEFLNIKNTNTSTIFYFVADNSPSLDIICVDSIDYATTNFDRIDAHTDFTENCGAPLCRLNMVEGVVQYDESNDDCVSGTSMEGLIITVHMDNGVTVSGVTDSNGQYTIQVPAEGNGTVSLTSTLPNNMTNPVDQAISFQGLGNSVTVDHCIESASFTDVKAYLYVPSSPRPGFTNTYILYVQNKGNTVANGTISLQYDDQLVEFISSAATPLSQTSNSITFEYNNLRTYRSRSYTVRLRTLPPPTVNGGDILTFVASVTPVAGDVNPEDNTRTVNLNVVNSYDPNDIAVMEGEEILEEQKDDYLNYRIRFQNTGTASAININIENVLDDDLDWNTFTPMVSSHSYRTEITNGNEIKFVYENINLPDSTSNQEGSNGYIFYKIKPKFSASVGDEFDNKADIFFDYNPPIITNTVKTTIVAPLAVDDFESLKNKISVFPVPFNRELKLTFLNDNIKMATLYSVTGKEVLVKDSGQKEVRLITENIPKGVYFLKITTTSGTVFKKVVKQ